MEKEIITMKKTTLWQITTGVLAVLLVISIFTYGFRGSGNSSNTNANNNDNAGNQGNNVVPTGVASVNAEEYTDDDAVEGSKNAKVTIVEFSDYQCPYCRKFWTETYSQLKEQYIDTGKAKLVFRDFPLSSLHPMAQASAEAAECVRDVAGNDEAYFKFHDKLFGEQNKLDSGNEKGAVTKTATYTNDDLKKWAKDLGYNIDNCLDSEKFKTEVQKDANDATSSGGQGTPYFLVGNQQLSGAYPFSAFQQAIEAQL